MYGMGMGLQGPYIDPQTGQWVVPGNNQGAYQNSQQPPQGPPQDGLIRVTGMQGAKAYQLPANSRAALFDDTDDILIIKMTDGAGFPSYRRARLDWIEDEPENDFMTRAEFRKEFEELKGLILNAKQPVRKPAKNTSGDDGE